MERCVRVLFGHWHDQLVFFRYQDMKSTRYNKNCRKKPTCIIRPVCMGLRNAERANIWGAKVLANHRLTLRLFSTAKKWLLVGKSGGQANVERHSSLPLSASNTEGDPHYPVSWLFPAPNAIYSPIAKSSHRPAPKQQSWLPTLIPLLQVVPPCSPLIGHCPIVHCQHLSSPKLCHSMNHRLPLKIFPLRISSHWRINWQQLSHQLPGLQQLQQK